MSKSSSIFSFDTIAQGPRPGRAVALAVAICALVRALLWLFPDAFLPEGESVREQQFVALESHFREAGNPSPRVLLMGTSRMVDLDPVLHARHLNLAPEEVANLSKIGNTFWDNLAFLRRNPAALRRLELVVMDIVPVQVAIGALFPENDVVFLRYASLEERWRVRSPVQRLKAFVDPVVPVWSRRLRVTSWISGLGALGASPSAKLETLHLRPWKEAREVKALRQAMEGRQIEGSLRAVAEFLFPDAPRSRVQTAALSELAALLPEQARLLLVGLPFRRDFRRIVDGDPAMSESRRSFRLWLEELDPPRTETVFVDRPSALGLSATDYKRDGTHFNEGGLQRLSRGLARLERPLFSGNPAADEGSVAPLSSPGREGYRSGSSLPRS